MDERVTVLYDEFLRQVGVGLYVRSVKHPPETPANICSAYSGLTAVLALGGAL